MHQLRTNPAATAVKRAMGFWPYAFILVSVTGLSYIVLHAIR